MRFVNKIFSTLAEVKSKQPTTHNPIELTWPQAPPNMVRKGWFLS
jgi:hypothetical protein